MPPTTVKLPPSTTPVNGIEICYEIHEPPNPITGAWENREWIVLINGLADTKETWSAQIPALLKTGCTVLTYDNRGIGGSGRPKGPHTSQVMAADLKGLVTALSVSTPFHLVGVSMGGMIAQSYTSQNPADVATLTLACTYAAPNVFCKRMFSLWANMAVKMSVADVMRDVIAWAFTPEFFEPENRDALAEVDKAMRELDMSSETYLDQLNVIQKFNSMPSLHFIKCPTLVLAGEGDMLIPVSLSEDLHELIPQSQFETVKGGHACLWEFPASFNSAVVAFITSYKQK